MLNVLITFLMITSVCFGISIDPTPATIIRATESSGLNHTEGVTFSPSGDYVLAVNSHNNSITFYKQISGSLYETTPSFTISGPQSKLCYPHDASFSPDGEYLAVANRHNNSIVIYKRKPYDMEFDIVPIAEIKGKDSQLDLPGAVIYSSHENSIIVANATTSSLTFYHYEGDHYDQAPYQVIQDTSIYAPDGLAVSMDGELLAATSHHSHSVVIFQRESGSGQFNPKPFQVIEKEQGRFKYPHSLAFHPITNDLVVSNSEGKQNIQLFQLEAGQRYFSAPTFSMEVSVMYDASTIHLLEKLSQEGGVKGVAISPDGKSLAVVQNLCDGLLHLPHPVSVLAVFPINE